MADLEAQTYTVDDFTGGMSDFIFEGVPSEFQLAENFLLTPEKKPITRPGSEVNSVTVYQIPAGNQRVGAIFSYPEYDTALFVQSARNVYVAGASWSTITNPNPVLSIGTTAGYIATAYWNKHVIVVNDEYAKPAKIFKSGASTYTVRTAGLPALASTPTGAGTAGAGNYLYALTMAVQYTIDGVVFEDEGPVTQIEVNSVNAPDVNAVTISGIPVLANGSTDNYDTANIKIRVYRTEVNSDVFYYVGEVTNGTTSFVDNVADSVIVNNVLLYTTGGVVDNDPPPTCKYVHSVEGYTIYAATKEGGVEYPNRVKQSIQDNPDAVPEDFFVELPQGVTGISSFDGHPIVFTASKIFRLEGAFDELGRDGPVVREFSETIGALNHNSIVQTREGVFFAGNDGFYVTNGFSITRISERLITTYNTMTATAAQRKRIVGRYDKLNNRVYWAMSSSTAAADNDMLFVLDLRFGVRPNSCFTTWKGGASFAPSAIDVFNGVLYRGDTRGYLLKHDESYLTDPKIDTAALPTVWQKQAIIYDYKSTFTNFQMPQIRKWVSRILISLKNISNSSVQLYSHNDNLNIFVPMVEVKDNSQLVWGDPNAVWGDASYLWNYFKLIEEERRFPKGSLRCSYKQVRITNSYTKITDSTLLGDVAVDATLKTATLSGGNQWPADLVDYYISFESDAYVTQYKVLSYTSTVLTFEDASNTSPNYTLGFKICGYAKGEICNLLGYTVYYSPISKTFKPYRAS